MSKDKSIDPATLPQSETYQQKNIQQQKHLNDMGKPVDVHDKLNDNLKGKPGNRTSKEEGLNENSNSTASEADV